MALSRGVAVLRTNIVDSVLGIRMFGVSKRGVRGVGRVGKERVKVEGEGEAGEVAEDELEDRRVLGAALAGMCIVRREVVIAMEVEMYYFLMVYLLTTCRSVIDSSGIRNHVG
jgi:hypothetical protein